MPGKQLRWLARATAKPPRVPSLPAVRCFLPAFRTTFSLLPLGIPLRFLRKRLPSGLYLLPCLSGWLPALDATSSLHIHGKFNLTCNVAGGARETTGARHGVQVSARGGDEERVRPGGIGSGCLVRAGAQALLARAHPAQARRYCRAVGGEVEVKVEVAVRSRVGF